MCVYTHYTQIKIINCIYLSEKIIYFYKRDRAQKCILRNKMHDNESSKKKKKNKHAA